MCLSPNSSSSSLPRSLKNRYLPFSVPVYQCSFSTKVRVAKDAAAAKINCTLPVSFGECFDTCECSMFFNVGTLNQKEFVCWVHACHISPTTTVVAGMIWKNQCSTSEKFPTRFSVSVTALRHLSRAFMSFPNVCTFMTPALQEWRYFLFTSSLFSSARFKYPNLEDTSITTKEKDHEAQDETVIEIESH